jgi:hypothetical protein
LVYGHPLRDCSDARAHGLRDPRAAPAAHGLDQRGAALERVGHDELPLRLDHVQAGFDRLGDELVDGIDRLAPLAHVERPQLAGAAIDRRVRRERLGVDQQAPWNQCRMNSSQGVDHALERDASQRPPAEREVESPTGHVQCLRAMDREADAVANVSRE